MITNKMNLPEVFVNLCKDYQKPIANRFSVTELLNSTRSIVLFRKHWEKLSFDVNDCISAMFGTAFHELMEKNAPDNVITEFKMEYKLGKYTIVGKCDVLDLDNLTIEDYKTCTTSKKDYDDDRKQGLMYAWLIYKKYGLVMRHLKFHNLYKDWSKLKSINNSNYPISAINTWNYDIQDSDYDYIEEYIINKLRDIENAQNALPECSDEECWYTGTKYAVYKNVGDKKAAIICDTEQEAHDYIINKCNGVGEIQIRKGEFLKCNYYCNVKEVCECYKKR